MLAFAMFVALYGESVAKAGEPPRQGVPGVLARSVFGPGTAHDLGLSLVGAASYSR
ncbi:hypothetical protein ABIE53_001043 [Burkholderia sp. OAS925]